MINTSSFNELKKTFNTKITLTTAWRRQQLRKLRKLFEIDGDLLIKAMKADLLRSDFESECCENLVIISEINTALDNLSQWMKPHVVGNSPINIGATSMIKPDPLGVILVLGAWNYPIQLTFAPVVGAIAAGNCVIIKPGSYAVNTAKVIEQLIPKYMDNNCIKVVTGNRETTQQLLEFPFDHIFFTGSTKVGKIIAGAAAKHLTPVTLELGGKSPVVIDATANIRHAANRIVWSSFINAGQTCVRPDFCLVEESIAQKFINQLKKTIEEFYTKNPQKSKFFGRCINDAAFSRLEKTILGEKDYLIYGGTCINSDKYIQPTLFYYSIDNFLQRPIMQREIFGPLLPITSYKKIEEALQVIKKLPTGKPLALYVHSTNEETIQRIQNETTSGSFCVNDAMIHLVNEELPFGGVGNSGMGKYHGKYSFDTFSHQKSILRRNPYIDEFPLVKIFLDSRFPPYTIWKKTIIRLLFHKWVQRAFRLLKTLYSIKIHIFCLLLILMHMLIR